MRWQFIVSEIGAGLRRNLAMTVSVILVTFVSLTFVGSAGLIQLQVGQMKSFWLDKVQVSIGLCTSVSRTTNCNGNEVTQDQIDAIQAQLESPAMQKYVKDFIFDDKAATWAKFQAQFGDQPEYSLLTEDDMQQFFQVQLKDPTKYQVVADMFSGQPGVDGVNDMSKVYDPLINALNKVTMLSIAFAGVMLVAAVLLITMTIRLSAMSRRRETSIMRLVGASNLFIQLPFMLEGAIAAMIGAVLAVVALWLGVKYLVQDWLAKSVQFMDMIDMHSVWVIAPFLVVGGILLAGISSLVTLRRYARV